MSKQNGAAKVAVGIMPERTSTIKSVDRKEWTPDNSKRPIYGALVDFENGDTGSLWNTDKSIIDQFSVGRPITYQLERTDKGKIKILEYAFADITPAERADATLTNDLNSMMSYAARYAVDLIIGVNPEKLPTPAQFRKTADMVYEWMKDKRLNEDYGQHVEEETKKA